MDPQPDVIRLEIEETRSSITDKLETLEEQVRDTVQSAKDTVQTARETVAETIESAKATVEETIDTVKSSVQETVQTVKRTFDVEYQVDRHPWTMAGLSLAAGFACGMVWPQRRSGPGSGYYAWSSSLTHNGPARALPPVAESLTPPARAERPGFFSHLLAQFDDEIDKVKGIAIGAVMASLRDMAKRTWPNLAPQIDDVMNSVTRKVGGEPVAGPAGSSPCPEPSARGPDSYR
jgi:ElaB/YqjD/DUF883 family membrane-anchored ribosome-binding protein